MKTYNYEIDLMLPMQSNKEILFNEAQIKLDSFCNSSVIAFIDKLPEEFCVGEKYILSQGENTDFIAYCTDKCKGWQILQPKFGMVIFVCEKESFYIFNHSSKWSKIQNNANLNEFNNIKTETAYIGIEKQFTISDSTRLRPLYLNNNCQILIDVTVTLPLTVIIKQNYKQVYKIEWLNPILWKDKLKHEITTTTSAVDILQFHFLPEDKAILGTIIGQNYQY